jgi:DNA modification methylase
MTRTHFFQFSTANVAEKANIHKDTLLRWLKQGLVEEPGRDRRGWRVWTEDQVQGVIAIARHTIEPANRDLQRDTSIAAVADRLRKIDWDFRDSKTTYLTHGIHPYPAKYIPQIPNALIQELSSVGETVADIFCGSGTTLLEGLLLRRHVVGVDANPLAALISKAKTTPLTDADKELLDEIADRSNQLASQIAIGNQPNLFSKAPFISAAPRPTHKAIKFWFEPFVVEELAELLSWCRDLPTTAARNLALVSLSAVIVIVSLQDSDTRYVRRTKRTKPGDAMRRFAQTVADNAKAAEKLSEVLDPHFNCEVFEGDVLECSAMPKVDLVVCSPPYPNAYSYHLYHMTRMIWMGMDQPDFKKREIGSHRKFSNTGKNGATIDTFHTEMQIVFRWLKDVVRKARHACFIVGDSTIRGLKYDNADVLTDAARSMGWSLVARCERNMKDTSKTFNPRIGKIKTERVVVFENGAVDE